MKIPLHQVIDPTDELAFKVEVLSDVGDTHEGTQISFGPSYSYSPTEKIRLGVSAEATYASDGYNETYFGIDADNASRSGLSQYDAEGGMKDVSVGVNATYLWDENWSATAVAGYTQLIGDAADSPIVEDEGSAGQGMVGVGISYRF